MAINLENRYPGRTSPSSAEYPTGAFINETTQGSDDGTPVDQAWARDFLGVRDAILSRAGVSPNDEIETATASQVLDALLGLVLQFLGFDPYVPFASGITINTREQTVLQNGVVYWWGGTLPHTTTSSFTGDWRPVRAAIVGKDAEFDNVTANSYDGPV